jgi:hypothetical protein
MRSVVQLMIANRRVEAARLDVKDFGFRRVIQFEPHDWENARYFWMKEGGRTSEIPESFIGQNCKATRMGVRNYARQALIRLSQLILYSYNMQHSEFICSDHVRQAFDHQSFIGLGWKPIEAVDVPDFEWQADNGEPPPELPPELVPWWELWPSLQLPPMHSSVEQRTLAAYPVLVNPRTQGPGSLRNAGMDDFHPVYTKAAINSLGDFDIARSYEYIYGPPASPPVHVHICSRRFMEYVKTIAPDSEWLPIEVRDE